MRTLKSTLRLVPLGVGLCVAAATLTWWLTPAVSWRLADGPIIFITIDTLRADHLPAYGYKHVATPAIDALVRDGILFERAYSHTPLTLPAHTSMFSGQLPFQHGVRDNVGFRVKTNEPLLPQLLREHGFVTAGVVSSEVLRGTTGIGKGFDFYDGHMPPMGAGAAIDEVQRDGLISLDIAQRWMASQTSRKFFLFLHLYEPHAPYTPPARYAQYAAYDGEIAYADEIVGRLVGWLRDRKWFDGSTILLMSDHGEGLGDHGEQEHGLFLYEEAVRVPLIVKLPAQNGRGRRVTQPVQHVDILPTILDLIGAPAPQQSPGRSLRPLLEEPRVEWPERAIYSEALFGRYHFGWSEVFALTETRFRLIRAPRDELYDLQSDPGERQNLAMERRSTRLALLGALDQILGGARIDNPEEVSPEVRDRLASLGYVGGALTGALSENRTLGLPDPKDRVRVLVSYRQALSLEAEGKLTAAVDLFRQIVRDEPAILDAWHRMARILLRLGLTEDAVSAFKQSVHINPAPSGLLELAAAILKLRRLDEAEVYASMAVKAAPVEERAQRAAAYEMLAKIALARPNAQLARRYATLGQEADPSFPLPAYVEGRLSYSSERYEEAWSSFEKALEGVRRRTAQIPDLHLYAGDTLAYLGRFDEAEREFREEIRFFPHAIWGYISLANLYQAFGRLQEAERLLTALVHAVPSTEAHAQAAELRRSSRRPPAAKP